VFNHEELPQVLRCPILPQVALLTFLQSPGSSEGMAYVFHGVIRFLASALARDGLSMTSQTFGDRYLVVTTDKGNAVTEIRKLADKLPAWQISDVRSLEIRSLMDGGARWGRQAGETGQTIEILMCSRTQNMMS